MDVYNKYNNKIGSVRETMGGYRVDDKHGSKICTAEKDLFGNDYTLKRHGDKIGRVEKNCFGEGYTVRDAYGHKTGTIKSSSSGSGFGILLFILFAVGVIICLSFATLKESLLNVFDPGQLEFYIIFIPAVLFIIYNIIKMIRRSDDIDSDTSPFFMEFMTAGLFFAAAVTISAVIGIFQGGKVLESLLSIPIIILYRLAAALVVFVPIALFYAIIFKALEKRKN